ncbi:conserved hypothetical protein [Roseibium sp. TrichSKD4]|uniref:AbiJ-NTD4 domain-containing protein n=1 Tax=Roseibium sp. TrichSKD4 TaxID=744980 RepID=UPI0001E5722A|nr:hypothetical protein [Roseibium sp. TrichSKD4]EFO28792.1 conserved hypothetical protein [Roseibium sp. TrichSKD4]
MTFSKRHNFAVAEPPITIREDAPEGLRYAAIINAHHCRLSYSQIRTVVCKVLLTAPDMGNWSEVPNIRDEVIWEINHCEWYKVYDVIEALVSFIEGTYGYQDTAEYVNSMNAHFVDAGIGWKYEAGEGIVYRGENSFQTATKTTSQVLEETGYQRASREISEAIADISRRPHPDVTGAISHAAVAIECVGNKILGTEKTGPSPQRYRMRHRISAKPLKAWLF